ncbi:MAG: DUF550 domain-containing protein [Candidatus Omnitrophica bacterium]|jgi:NTP pyrophosphatase (non-canonical NTP hydrolase)|nr:DUF550 domain-containing protein [Candidatus Omnitrophota bacterium]
MTDREAQYIKETGDKKPDTDFFTKYGEINYIHALWQWQRRFSIWLSARLEKAEKEKDSMGKLQLEIGDWQDEAFPKANALSKMSHLAKEIIELNKALLYDTEMIHKEELIAGELADCQHLLFGIASKCGIYLYRATKDKFEINKKRKWGKPDENGVVEHIK